jgi:hypothetical protein
MPDTLGRPDVAPSIREAIARAFDGVEGRGALLMIADERGTRAHLAAKLADHWKVAAGGGFNWSEKKPSGFVAVEAVW